MKLEELLERQEISEYEDERINSNFYMISLSTALRKLKSMEGSRDYEEKKRKNEWLREISPKSEKTGAISLDHLKSELKLDVCSCDGFMYYAGKNEDKVSVIFEMKNVNRSKMIEFISSHEKDSIWEKVKDSVALLQEEIEFSGTFTGKELIKHTHVLLIYGGKADTVSEAVLGIGKKQTVKRNEKGHQARAAYLPLKYQSKYSSKKSEEDVFKKFSEELGKKGLASCKKGYFGVPIKDPEWEKRNGQKVLGFTMLSKEDLCKIIEDIKFFENWDWGIYNTYFNHQ